MWGNYLTLGNSLATLFGSQFSPVTTSLIGAIFVISGAIGCFVMGMYLDKTQKFRQAVRFISIGLFFMLTASMVILPIGSLWLTSLFAIFTGLLNVPILPSAFQYAVKVTVRMPPAVLNGLMMSGAMLWGFISTITVTYLLNISQDWGLAFLTINLAVSLLCATLIKEESELTTVPKVT